MKTETFETSVSWKTVFENFELPKFGRVRFNTTLVLNIDGKKYDAGYARFDFMEDEQGDMEITDSSVLKAMINAMTYVNKYRNVELKDVSAFIYNFTMCERVSVMNKRILDEEFEAAAELTIKTVSVTASTE